MNRNKIFAVLISASVGLSAWPGAVLAEDPDNAPAAEPVEYAVQSERRSGDSEASMKNIFTLFDDDWNGAEGTPLTMVRRQSNTTFGGSASALRIRSTSANKSGTADIRVKNDKTFASLDNMVAAAANEENAYFGCWFYRAEETVVSLIADDKVYPLDTAAEEWQFVYAKISADTKLVTFSFENGDCFLDELGIFAKLPEDISPVVTPVYYAANGEPDTVQGVTQYFDIQFNHAAMDRDAVEVVLKKRGTEEEYAASVTWTDGKTMRIKPQKTLAFNTQYSVAISNYENIYGGSLDSYSFVFQTQPEPVQLVCTETIGTGMVDHAKVSASLTNTTAEQKDFILFALAQAGGQTIAAAASEGTVAANDSETAVLEMDFDSTDANKISFSYLLFGADMMPVNLTSCKPASQLSVEDVKLTGNMLSIDGIFDDAVSGRTVTAAVTPAAAGAAFDSSAAVTVLTAESDPQGRISLSEMLYDGLDSGRYIVFIWGEGDSRCQQFEFFYSSLKDRSTVIEQLLAGTAAQVLECLNYENNYEILNTLGVLIAEYRGLPGEGKTAVSRALANASDKTEDRLAEIINTEIVLQMINTDQQKIGNTLVNYAKYLPLSEKALQNIKAFSESPQELTAVLQGKSLDTVNKLEKELTGTDMILLALSSAADPEVFHALLTENSKALRFDADKIMTDKGIAESDIPLLFAEMAGKKYASLSELETAFYVALDMFIEGPPFNATVVAPIFTDSVQDGYISAWSEDFKVTEVTDRVKNGTKALCFTRASGSNAKMGEIFLNHPISQKAAQSMTEETAYIGMWVYIPAEYNGAWFQVMLVDDNNVEHTEVKIDRSKKGRWQYSMTQITQDVKHIYLKTENPLGVWLDDIQVISVPPVDPAAEVTGITYYDWENQPADSQNQYVSSYIDVSYNFATNLSYVSGIRVKNKETGAAVPCSFSIEGNKTVRIQPSQKLEYDTEYIAIIGSYENVFGGGISNYSFTFKTAQIRIRFEDAAVAKGSGKITSAKLTGTLYNENIHVKNLTVYLLAKSAGETVGLARKNVDFKLQQSIDLQVEFPEMDSDSVQISYQILTDKMVPIHVDIPQAESELVLEKSEIVRKKLEISGSFAEPSVRAVTAALVPGLAQQYDPAAAVTILVTDTDASGKFACGDILRDSLPTGEYTIFIWGEGAEKPYAVNTYYAGGMDRGRIMAVLANGTPAEIQALLAREEEHRNLQAMGILMPEYQQLGELQELAAAYIAALPAASKSTEEAAVTELNAVIAVLYVKTAQNPSEALLQYASYIGLPEETIYLVQSILEDDREETLNALLRGEKYENAAELRQLLADQLLLMAVNTVNSNNHIKMKELLGCCKAELGFDAAALITANDISEYNEMLIYQGMLNQKFSSLAACKTRFYSLIDKYKPKQGGSGGPDKTGGNGSGNGGVPIAVQPVLPEEAAAEKTAFADISGHWAKQSIEYLYKKGIVSGRDEANFCPNDTITREEFVQILILALELADSEAAAAFTDIPQDRWSYAAAASAYQLGIASGYPDGSFGAAQPITREDMAVMIFRALEFAGKVSGTAEADVFSDDAQISEYAREAVHKLRQAGIINGAGNNEFMPKNFSTRAEAAQMIYSLIK